MTEQTLSDAESADAKSRCEEFWRQHSSQKNPSDINTPEKAAFLIMKGFEKIALMLKARKQAYPFTKRD